MPKKDKLRPSLPSAIFPSYCILRADVCRPCVEIKLTATKKSATDGN